MALMQNDIEHMRKDIARVEQQDIENARDIKQLTKQIPPPWVAPLVTSLPVAGIVLAITLAIR